MWKESNYDNIPSPIDESISEKYVYVRKDIKKSENGYTCKEAKIPKEFYSLYEQNLALSEKAETLEVTVLEQRAVIEEQAEALVELAELISEVV